MRAGIITNRKKETSQKNEVSEATLLIGVIKFKILKKKKDKF